MTRTQNSFFNYITDQLSTILVIFLNFVTRSVFIRYLGTSFLGIEGLFTNILSMLSLAELKPSASRYSQILRTFS